MEVEFAPYFAPFDGKNMQKYADICKNMDFQTG